MPSCVVRAGTLVTPEGCFEADVVSQDGRIVSLAESGRAPYGDVEIDAHGLLVFPGFVDPHVHSRDPGLTHKEDFLHATRAAVAGGVTTVFDMPNAVPSVTNRARFELRAAEHAKHAHVDFGLWGIALGGANAESLGELVEAGVVGLKLFWGYAFNQSTGELVYNPSQTDKDERVPPPTNGEVLEIFETAARLNCLLAVHCEDREIIEALGKTGSMATYQDLLRTRPEISEAASIALGLEFARATGCRFHVVHVSSKRGIELIRRAQAEGVAVSAETCPQYLTLTDESFTSVGPSIKVFPPIRQAAHQDALWEGIDDGTITLLGSDHSPHTLEEKSADLGVQPAGVLGVETLGALVVNEMMLGRVTTEKTAWLLSEGAARLFRVYPQKGVIRPGADADFTLVNPHGTTTIKNTRLHSKTQLTPWDGAKLKGNVCVAVLRGEVAMRDGEPVDGPRGKIVFPVKDELLEAG